MLNHKYISIFLLCLTSLILNACKPQILNEEELNSYIRNEKNGLKKHHEKNGHLIEAAYRPVDLLIKQELPENWNEADIQNLKSRYSKYHYFIISFSKNNREALHQSSSFEAYSELLQNLSFRMHDYTMLTTAKHDTIPLADFMLDRTFGMASSTNLMMVFNKEKTTDSEWLQLSIKDPGLGVGMLHFKFLNKDLNRVPQLKFD